MGTHRIIEVEAEAKCFDALAPDYAAVAEAPRTIGEGLLARLEVFKFQPRTILEVGCGTGQGLCQLQTHYPAAQRIGLDRSQAMLREAQHTHPSAEALISADLRQLPFNEGTFDLVIANLVLHWLPDLKIALLELQRVLKAPGLLMATMLGPDTLREFHSPAGESREAPRRLPVCRDLQTVGEALSNAQFKEVVLDVERLHLRYEDLRTLVAEMQLLGLSNLLPDDLPCQTSSPLSMSSLPNRRALMHDKPLTIGWEVLYAHAWKATDGNGNRDAETQGDIVIPFSGFRRWRNSRA